VKRLRVAAVYGGVGMGPQAKRARHADIVIATPGRLLDLVQRKLLRLDRVRICVLDEADRMLDMGFLPDVTRILELLRPERQTMLFSATLDGEVGRLAQRFTDDPVRHHVLEPDGPLVSESDHRFVAVAQADRTRALVRELAADRGLTLVFVRTKRGADRLAKNLKAEGFRVGALHGGMMQGARERALGRFAAGANDVLVATDVAARGLDLEHITHVINFDPPADEKDYLHRVGRTARAGRSGTGITFVTPEKRKDVGRIATVLELQTEFRDAGFVADVRRPTQPTRHRRSRRGAVARSARVRPEGYAPNEERSRR
jgi:ATP-dependent RNA helicase RhlE